MSDKLYELDDQHDSVDPDEIPVRDRKLVTQPVDMSIDSLYGQIKDDAIHVRPLSQKPKFQRKYVWNNKFASQLIESLLLNVPIPPIYMAENDDFQYDVIDGQQRVYSIFRYLDNQFKLSGLEVLTELNGVQFFQLDKKLQSKIKNKTLRCVVITADSHPEIKFEVFERLNTNTAPLNAQELRNCTNRGTLNDLLGELAEYEPWLEILGRKEPDKRLRDEELILRYFAFTELGVSSYRTPQKHWLNEMARAGTKYDEMKIETLRSKWKQTIDKCLLVFDPLECFRRPSEASGKRTAINKALMDIILHSLTDKTEGIVLLHRYEIKAVLNEILSSEEPILNDDTFNELISRAVDHTARVKARFAAWNIEIEKIFSS